MIPNNVDWGTTSSTGLTVIRVHDDSTGMGMGGAVWVDGRWYEVTLTYATAEIVLPEPEDLVVIPPWPWPPWPAARVTSYEVPRRPHRRRTPTRRRSSTGVRNWRPRHGR